VPGRLDHPCLRRFRDAGGSPLGQSGRKSLLHRLLGHIEVVDKPDQRGYDPAPIGAIEYLAANPLHSTATATSVRVRDGNPLITDGPFAETRDQLGGYFLIDAKDLDEAISIAARIPGARLGTVEIRPVMEIPGMPTV